MTPLARWLRRPSRLPRRLRAATAFALAGAALVMLSASLSTARGQGPSSTSAAGAGNLGQAGGTTAAPGAAPDKYPFPQPPGAPTVPASASRPAIAAGATLYEESCASCHGMALQGRPGIAPSLRGVGPGPVDFYLSTGRMPLQDYRQEPERGTPLFGSGQIADIAAFVASYGGPPAPAVNVARGDLAFGLHEFTLNCAGCHQIVGRGGLTVGARVPELSKATPQQIAEAIRMGPYLMPHFDATQIDQHALDSIARYVLWTREPDNAGGWGIYNLGPVPEGLVAWFLAIGSLLIVARLIGERTAT
jgi:quinol---cytochrome-c reductase cytochrome c subunit